MLHNKFRELLSIPLDGTPIGWSPVGSRWSTNISVSSRQGCFSGEPFFFFPRYAELSEVTTAVLFRTDGLLVR